MSEQVVIDGKKYWKTVSKSGKSTILTEIPPVHDHIKEISPRLLMLRIAQKLGVDTNP